MRRWGLVACAGAVLALVPASAAWGQEVSPTANDEEGVVLAAASASASASSSSVGAAAITEPCPAVIVRNTTLKQDCVGPITFGADRVQLNLGGHTVTCNEDGRAIGIAVVDRVGDRIVNGTVRDCGTGILLLRGGEHQVRNVALDDHDQNGPATRPATGTFNFGTGLEVHRSVGNDVVNVRAARNRIGVFNVVGADGNRYTSLEITEGRAPFSAMEIQSSSHNTITSSRFVDGFFEGLLITGGTGNVVRSSTATGNVDGIGIGFVRPTIGTVVQSSDLSGNRRDGILLFSAGDATTVKSNRATENARSGIRVGSGSTDNELTSNTARGNPGFDLADDNPACDNNIWLHNNFETANQPCIE